MTLAEVGRILLRQWWVILIGVLLSGGLTAFAAASVPPTYSSTSVVMLLQQKNSAVEGGENPYLVMDASLTVTGEALLRAVTDDAETLQFVAATDPKATFVIDPVLNGPFLQTTTEAATKAETLALQAGIRTRLATKLTELQTAAGAPAKLQIKLADVSEAAKPIAVNGRKIQLVAGIALVGLALTTTVAFLVDRLRARRKRRKEQIVDRSGEVHEERRTKPVPVFPLPDPLAFLGASGPAAAAPEAPAAQASSSGKSSKGSKPAQVPPPREK